MQTWRSSIAWITWIITSEAKIHNNILLSFKMQFNFEIMHKIYKKNLNCKKTFIRFWQKSANESSKSVLFIVLARSWISTQVLELNCLWQLRQVYLVQPRLQVACLVPNQVAHLVLHLNG